MPGIWPIMRRKINNRNQHRVYKDVGISRIDNEATIVNGIPYVPKVKWRHGRYLFKKVLNQTSRNKIHNILDEVFTG